MTLHWAPSREPDFLEYRLYRGATAGFVPSEQNRIATQRDTGYADHGVDPMFYKLIAVDRHGNAGTFSQVDPKTTTAVSASAGLEFGLAPVAPNPVRSSARLRFALPREGEVSLSVFDAMGRRVRGLSSGVLSAGPHEVEWDGRDQSGRPVADGIYFVRLEALGRIATRRMVTAH